MNDKKKLSRFSGALIRSIGDQIAPRAKGRGRLCIVNYHRILEAPDPLLDSEPDVATFRWQMELLAEHFNVLPLHDALDMLERERMPARAIAITFDDGYRSTHDLAMPILKSLNLPATVFVTTGYVDEGTMWNDRILEVVRNLPNGELDMREIGHGAQSLQTLDDRRQLAHKLMESAKYRSPRERMETTQKLEELVGKIISRELMLKRDMLTSLIANNIEVGAHTITHPILTSLTDEEARHEILGGKQQIEALTGRPARLFAYPNGKVGMDFDARHVQMAKDAGFSAAFTTAIGPAMASQDRFQIPRSRPWDKTPTMFAIRLLGWLANRAI